MQSHIEWLSVTVEKLFHKQGATNAANVNLPTLRTDILLSSGRDPEVMTLSTAPETSTVCLRTAAVAVPATIAGRGIDEISKDADLGNNHTVVMAAQ